MNQTQQRTAQQRADRIVAFRAELAELEREQGLVLTADQRSHLETHLEGVLAELAKRFGVDVSESAKRISWGIRIVILLGGAAFFAALVLLLHRIWGMLPLAAQALALTAIPLLLLAAGELAFRRSATLYYTALLVWGAGAALVTGLNALGGTLNVVLSPHVLLAWAAFAILVAYAYGLRLLLGAGLVLFCACTAALWVAARGGYWVNLLDRAGLLIPAAAALYTIPGLKAHRDPLDFDSVFRICGAATMLVALLILPKTGDLSWIGLSAQRLEAVCQIIGLALSVGVMLHGFRLRRSSLANLGATSFIIFLYVRLYTWWWDWMPKYLFFLLLGIIAVALFFLFRRIRMRLSENLVP
jgi:hypothetical protein